MPTMPSVGHGDINTSGSGRVEMAVETLELRDLRAVSVLGRGAKGVVFHARHGGRSLALKVISRSAAEGGGYRRIWFERDVLAELRHPLLPSLRGFVSTDEVVAFAIDRCPGGDLNSLRKRQTEGMFSEDIIRFYAAEIVLALEHLHKQGIVYRDLKPENILIQSDGHLMLVDFDLSTRLLPTSTPSPPPPPRQSSRPRTLSRRIRPPCFPGSPSPTEEDVDDDPQSSSSTSSSSSLSSGKTNSFVGTEEYVAPEVIEGKGHDHAVDWWGLGVLMYEMLYGRTPFRGRHRRETFYRILSMAPDLEGEPTQLRDLVGRLLEKDPSRRIGCDGVKRHEFFKGVHWEGVAQVERPPFIPMAALDGEEDEDEDEDEKRGAEGIDVEVFVRELAESIAARRNKKVEDAEGNEEGGGNWVGGVVEGGTAAAKKASDFGVF